jgi:hypothetical protein
MSDAADNGLLNLRWAQTLVDALAAAGLRAAVLGIVAGSDPAQELAETEAKLAVIAEALRQALPAVHRPESRSA